MCAVRATGVPEVGACVPRDRLSGRIRRAEHRTCLLVAPSGYGKTVLAAQFASNFESAMWLGVSDAGAHAGRDVARAALAFLQRGALEPSDPPCGRVDSGELAELFDAIETLAERESFEDMCVVVDDVGPNEATAVMEVIRDLGIVLRRRVWFLVTARVLDGTISDLVRDALVLDGEDLRLTEAEAISLVQACSEGLEAAPDATSIRFMCGGHVALFLVLLQKSLHRIALGDGSSHDLNLDLWLRHMISSQMSDAQRELLASMALLGEGFASDLIGMNPLGKQVDVRRLAAMLPLVVLSEDSRGRLRFAVHDLVLESWRRDARLCERIDWTRLSSAATSRLTGRRDLARASEILRIYGEIPTIAAWLLENGTSMLESGLHRQLDSLLEMIPIPELFAHPRLLLLSSVMASEADDFEDALGRSRAALSLAEHEDDTATKVEALSRCVWNLCRLGQFGRASELSAELVRQPLDAMPSEVRAASLLALGAHAAAQGEFDLSRQALDGVEVVLAGGSWDSRARAVARIMAALLPSLATGDFIESSLRLAQVTDGTRLWPSDRLVAKGNLAVSLCETGRLERARSLLVDVVARARGCALRFILGSYLPVLGSVYIGLGEVSSGTALIREGIGFCLESGDEPSAQANRVYLATVLRASGDFEASLNEAQRAFEHLSVEDAYKFKRLAALEIAASLLALGDISAARARAEEVKAEGFDGNRWHAIRAEMILAEADRRDGRLAEAVNRISTQREYLLSGNSNWQAAMYCRAFPELLGVFALAIGSENLPAHLLKIILPGQAERSLELSRSFLDDATWRSLGVRLLAAAEFERLAAREDGPPVCHVRLFGGLDVSIGGRSIRERDWRKRKARLLFTMLVTRRGRDVSRDQVCEYLWPEMDEGRAKNNLYVSWSTMKAVLLGDSPKGVVCPYVESVGGVCRVVADAIRTDLDDFEAALSAARDAEATGNTLDALGHYERLLTIYTGDLLPGDIYDDWFAGEREHFRTEFEDAMLRATRILSQNGNPGEALPFVRRAIHHDPIREDLNQVALRCLIDSGQRNSAIEAFFLFKSRFAEELGLDPSPETQALYDEILAMEERPRRIPANATIDDLPD